MKLEEPDKEISECLDELRTILMPSALFRLQTKLGQLYEKIEELKKSRDNWKEKYNSLKTETN